VKLLVLVILRLKNLRIIEVEYTSEISSVLHYRGWHCRESGWV